MDSDDHDRDIPIWFNGTQRWMAGLTKRTTCDDVIYAILFNSGLHESESTENFAIFEKWREVERPLSSRTKILKVWSIWGEEQPNVNLTMRSLNDYFLPGESSLYMRSKRRSKRPGRQRSRHSINCKCADRRSCGECTRLRSLEHLVKLVVTQERKLQDISGRILDTDRLIEQHEGRIHDLRVQQNGLDYVQESYLNSHSSGSSSSLDSSSLSVATLDLNEASRVFPESTLAELGEITRMCDQLTHLERCLTLEREREEELEPEVRRLQQEIGVTEEHREAERGKHDPQTEKARVELLRAVTNHVNQEYNERIIDRRLEACLTDVNDKVGFLQALEAQVSEIESRLTSQEKLEDKAAKTGHTVSRPPRDMSFNPYGRTVEDRLKHATPTDMSNSTRSDLERKDDSRQNIEHFAFLEGLKHTTINHATDRSNGGYIPQTDSESSGKFPGKSMTGRGRFAKDYVPKRPILTQQREQEVGSSKALHNHRIQNHSGNNSPTLTSETTKSGSSPPLSYSHHMMLVGGDTRRLTTNSFVNTTSTNGQEVTIPVNNVLGDTQVRTNNSIGPPRLDSHSDHEKIHVTDSHQSNSWIKNSEHVSEAQKWVTDGGVTPPVSCQSSVQPGTKDGAISREGRSRLAFKQRGKEMNIRSRSADRERPSAQAHRFPINSREVNGINNQYCVSENETKTISQNDLDVVNSYGLEISSMYTHKGYPNGYVTTTPMSWVGHMPTHSATSHNSSTPNLASSSQRLNMPHPSSNNTSTSSPTDGAVRDSMNFSNSSFQNQPANLNGVIGYSQSNADEMMKLHKEEKDQHELIIPANKPASTTENERQSPRNFTRLHTSGNLRAVGHAARGKGSGGGEPSVQAMSTNQSGMLPFPVSSKQPQQKTKESFQPNGTKLPHQYNSHEQFQYHQNSEQRNMKGMNNISTNDEIDISRDKNSKVQNGTNFNGGVEDSSRGALYHIVSKKMNASKEKIRLENSSPKPDITKRDTDENNARGINSQQYLQHKTHSVVSNLPSHHSNSNQQNLEKELIIPEVGGRSFVLSTVRAPAPAPLMAPARNPILPSNYQNQTQQHHDYQRQQHRQPFYNQQSQQSYQSRHLVSSRNYDNQQQNNINHLMNQQQQVTSRDGITQYNIGYADQNSRNAPHRRGAMNPHFYDPSTYETNKAATKFSLRGPSSQPSNISSNTSGSSHITYLSGKNNSDMQSAMQQKQMAKDSTTSSSIHFNGVSIPDVARTGSFDPTRTKLKLEDNNDSDTGLSSMHSDETTNMETLV